MASSSGSQRTWVAAAIVGVLAGIGLDELLRSQRGPSPQRTNVAAVAPSPARPAPSRQGMEPVHQRIRLDGEKKVPDQVRADVRELEVYYAGDPYALAQVAFSEAETHRDVFHSLDDEVTCLMRAIDYVQEAQRQLLLLEMKARLDRADVHNSSPKSERNQFIAMSKEGLALEGKAVPPLYGDVQRDAAWKDAIKERYIEGCKLLFQVAMEEELEGFNVWTPVREYLQAEYPKKLAVVAKVSAAPAERNRTTKEWLQTLTQGEVSVEDAEIVQNAIAVLDKWWTRQVVRKQRLK